MKICTRETINTIFKYYVCYDSWLPLDGDLKTITSSARDRKVLESIVGREQQHYRGTRTPIAGLQQWIF